MYQKYVFFKVLRSLALSSKAATFGYPKARGATKQFNFNGKRRESLEGDSSPLKQ